MVKVKPGLSEGQEGFQTQAQQKELVRGSERDGEYEIDEVKGNENIYSKLAKFASEDNINRSDEEWEEIFKTSDSLIIDYIIRKCFCYLSEEVRKILINNSSQTMLEIIFKQHYKKLSLENTQILLPALKSEILEEFLLDSDKITSDKFKILLEFNSYKTAEILGKNICKLSKEKIELIARYGDEETYKIITKYINKLSSIKFGRLLKIGGLYIYQIVIMSDFGSSKVITMQRSFRRMPREEFMVWFNEMPIKSKIMIIISFPNFKSKLKEKIF